MTELEKRLLKASSAVYLACEKEVADDLSGIMQQAHTELAALREENERLRKVIVMFQNGFDTIGGPSGKLGEELEDVFRPVMGAAREALKETPKE